MSEEKNENTERETKAGLMEENSDKVEEIEKSAPSEQKTKRKIRAGKDRSIKI